jgi:hypothetical protein
MRWPPESFDAAGAGRGVGDRHSGSIRDALNTRLPQAPQEADFERLDDLHALWRWRASLEHRVRIAKLRFEFVGLDGEEQDKLATEVAQFGQVAAGLAEISKRRAAA